jgi:hypothetical protein
MRLCRHGLSRPDTRPFTRGLQRLTTGRRWAARRSRREGRLGGEKVSGLMSRRGHAVSSSVPICDGHRKLAGAR